MHPVITQAVAAERTKEFLAHAAAEHRGRQLHRSRRSRHAWLAAVIPGSGHGQDTGPAPWPVRGPRAA
jgi:hypothetical protein